ncbi:MAG: hypothetical protein DRQ61_10520 [Gammaproteobacteria bacterium]|nr:MAG: hypothetical protein DRQ61_10520 [Gammaproteobacteria bacterium]
MLASAKTGSSRIEPDRGLEFTMRDSISAIEELSLNALFSMNGSTFEVVSIQPESEPIQAAQLKLV